LKAPLHLQKVRQAISLAFDRIEFNKRYFNNLGTIPHSYIPPNFAGHNAQLLNPYISYDLHKARQLLAEAGYPNGEGFPTLTLDMSLYRGKNLKSAIAFFVDCMNQLGICVKVQELALPDLISKTQRGDHMLAFLDWRADFPDFSSIFDIIRYPGIGGGFG
jgi:ABC-type transport system substrate-binding protein